jgi:hypothetical protein
MSLPNINKDYVAINIKDLAFHILLIQNYSVMFAALILSVLIHRKENGIAIVVVSVIFQTRVRK